MRRTLYAFVALALFTAVSCKKDDDINDVPDKGAVRYINVSGDHYEIFLDGYSYGSMYGYDTSFYPNISTGAHFVKAQQLDVPNGILRQQQIFVNKDSVTTFIFP